MVVVKFIVGEVLFEKLNISGTGHSAMCVAPGKIVHAMPDVVGFDSGVILADDDDLSGKIAVFACQTQAVSVEAARLARAWANPQRKTRFSGSSGTGLKEGRAIGIKEAEKDLKYTQFGADALYRAFKWATNGGTKAFSENRGTTCAPFVTACYQAAWVRYHFNFNEQELAEVFKILKDARGPKAPKNDRINQLHFKTESGTLLGRRPMPQYSRVEGQISAEHWELIAKAVKRLSGRQLNEPKDLVTPGLFVEAKFNSTRAFAASLAGDSANWTKKPEVSLAS